MLQEDIYNEQIINFAANISHLGSLPAPDVSARAVSRLCGSEIDIELCFDREQVSKFAHRVQACILGQASAAIVAGVIIGSTKTEIRDLVKTMRAFLRENGTAPQGKFAELKILESTKQYKTRHPSMLLIFDALEDCLNQLEQPNG